MIGDIFLPHTCVDSMTGDKDEEIAPSRPLSYLLEGFKPTPMQKSFQPGSTPEHLSSRFMVSTHTEIGETRIP